MQLRAHRPARIDNPVHIKAFKNRVKDGYTALAYVFDGAAYFDEIRDTVSTDASRREPQGSVHDPESVILYERGAMRSW